MPEISIIVPVYKVEKYLRHCVDSILAQTFTDFELLLIDDGSPDNSGAICDEYAEKDNRVRVFHKENGGVSSARNLGLDNARGTYIMFCDSDDYVADNWAEKLYEFMNYNEANLSICGYNFVMTDASQIIGKADRPKSVLPAENKALLWELKEKALLYFTWNKMFRSSIIHELNLRFEDGLQFSEDELFVLAYLEASNYQFTICSERLYNYRTNVVQSLTHRYIFDLWNLSKRVMQEEKNAILNCGIPFETVSVSFYSSWIWCVVHSIQNNLMEDSPLSFREMLHENNAILNSDECKTAFKNGLFRCIVPAYRVILKTHSSLAVWLFHCAVKAKQRICKPR